MIRREHERIGGRSVVRLILRGANGSGRRKSGVRHIQLGRHEWHTEIPGDVIKPGTHADMMCASLQFVFCYKAPLSQLKEERTSITERLKGMGFEIDTCQPLLVEKIYEKCSASVPGGQLFCQLSESSDEREALTGSEALQLDYGQSFKILQSRKTIFRHLCTYGS